MGCCKTPTEVCGGRYVHSVVGEAFGCTGPPNRWRLRGRPRRVDQRDLILPSAFVRALAVSEKLQTGRPCPGGQGSVGSNRATFFERTVVCLQRRLGKRSNLRAQDKSHKRVRRRRSDRQPPFKVGGIRRVPSKCLGYRLSGTVGC